MKKAHVLGKGCRFGQNILVLGGSGTNVLEMSSLPDLATWTENKSIKLMENKLFSKTAFAKSY